VWIQKFILENFQSHDHTVIEFHPNYNCLVGIGDSGKTSVIRALSFILFGVWDGSWIRHGAKFCRLILITNNGIEIIREKGEGINRYVVHQPGKEEQIYESFGIHVPQEIEQLLQIFRVQIDNKEFLNLNLSEQHDDLFLLKKPGSYKAKVFGQLSGGHYLDHALRELNKDKRNLNAEKHLKETECLELEKELMNYENLNTEKEKLDALSERIHQVMRKMEFIQQVKQLSSRVSTWKLQYTAEIEKERKFAKINLDKGKNLDELVIKLNQLKLLKDKINEIIKNISVVSSTGLRIDELKEKVLQDYNGLLQTHKKCPTCFGDIGETQLAKIRENLK